MNKYTPEPWVAHTENPYGVFDSKGSIIVSCTNLRMPFVTREENAKRIAACVNYCEGASNQELENSSWKKAKEHLMDTYSLLGQYRAQRDALLKAAQNIIRKYGSDENSELRQAISTVKRHDHSTDPMITALLQIVQDSQELPHIQSIAKAALEKGGAL